MREITEITTEQMREASSKGFVSSLGYRSIADNEFDYWLFSERQRVAKLAIAKERERIYTLIEDIAEELYKIPGVFELTQREVLLYTVILLKEIRED